MDGKDGSKRNIDTKESDLPTVLLHLFYTKSKDCIQISVFHKRNDFFWIGKAAATQIRSVAKHLHFGQFEAAFEFFKLKQSALAHKSNMMMFLVPNDQVRFLSQIETSRFMECNYDMAKKFNAKHKTLAQNTELNRKVKEGLKLLKNLTSDLMIEFFIACGTLLGWYRQCGVISYTTDLDTGSWSRFTSEELIEQFANNKAGLRMKFLFGLVDNGLEFAVITPSNLRVDLFFLYPEDGKLVVTVHLPSTKSYRRQYYPNFTLCSAELEGMKVLGACETEEVLRSG